MCQKRAKMSDFVIMMRTIEWSSIKVMKDKNNPQIKLYVGRKSDKIKKIPVSSSVLLVGDKEAVPSYRQMASWVLKEDPSPYQVAELIIAGIIPTILLIGGTIGNLLSIFVLLRKENRNSSTNIYLVFLCLMDTLSLYQWNLNYIVYEFTGGQNQILSYSLFLCKSGLFLSFYTLHASAIFLTFVELDRACLLRSSWYKRKIAQPHVALIFAATTLAALFALNGFLLGFGATFSMGNNATGTEITFFVCYYSWNGNLNGYFSNQYAWVSRSIIYIWAASFSLNLFYLGSSGGGLLFPIYSHDPMYTVHGEEALHQANERQRADGSQCSS